MAEYQMTLVDRQTIARDTMAFWFDANGARYEFRAGQHADFVFRSESDNSHTFSLASSPRDREPIMIAMRMRPTVFKNALRAAALGTKFTVSRPRGSFSLPPRNVCHTNCICFIPTAKPPMPHSWTNCKAWLGRILTLLSC